MKHLLIIISICAFSSLATQAQESATLPDLPNTQSTPSTPDMVAPESTTRSLPDTRQANPRVPRMTQEQIDKANKDKNWLTEGLKEKELQAEALREQEARSQKSIIDEILERNQQQASATNPENTANSSQENGKMKAALSTTAWEPLEPMQSSSYAAAMGEDAAQSDKKENYKRVDEKTGISNVFFNPATGSFDSQPSAYNSNLSNRPELQKPWIQQNTPTADTSEEKQVAAFEARMIQQAQAQNKLPQNYQNQNLSVNDSRTGLLAASNSSAGNSNTINSNLTNTRFGPNNTTASNNSYAASAARLRMMEEERQRKLKEDKRPKAIDIHSPFKGKGVEINPRF